MPLFACSKCNAVENTALGEYWSRPKAPLCSECSGLFNRWHGRFPKEQADNGDWEPDVPRHPHFLRARPAPHSDREGK